ncbi:bifunctional D-glycero-beta-D-manno-heptose-7-phosphate kinase/D-glycero-beta-D-manno-heptose 1-phosphate adenylyltransferase HldE [Spiribacter vilamensis]|uniref:Bifunctional protein HldE n=1 Tax=Spiribacter vilamensis TaxID=531306 RepID=A0A4Q8D233_9GAMM|nr:bifunctional D-glycero-beta-D-manno-heptose-7-phosphate kinase/D-glycero-beta-D-manno-heptose 1-phosphate adenylyltransferase HldE [Spiribacter vilamensis]RZU99403.1 D-beta-D-heptose 7-phosphate kinase/D-beta-D-heptose 1-phosphate adenosyltransferase [Spiribacter vilamensis]TVO61620.1 bifunctional D-glycero-beta-D-manno-heptose-7-phosphate kinase/D-glycero-beta-D-manno-heptose 1-phosphate adenylyltransferase HldE [Spiribacter vilamensis]
MQLELPDFGSARVLVVGDVMLDRYWHGPTSRISPEAPVPVLRVDGEDMRPGGAANVAMNLGALGAQVRVIGLIGDDDHGRLLESRLREGGVEPLLQRVDTHPTICKLRVLSQRQQLMRLDFERPFTATETNGLTDVFAQALAETDVVIISDYAKGTLSHVEALIGKAREVPVPILVDPKGTDWHGYAGATLLTPNVGEFKRYQEKQGASGVDRDQEVWDRHGLEEVVPAALDELSLDGMLVTRGEAGMSLLRRGAEPFHLPAHAREVFDVTGAGDTVIALLAASLAAGVDLRQATALANLAASLVVAKVGTASVTVPELEAATGQSPGDYQVTDPQSLVRLLEPLRQRGERIVMTNGCFDLLHAGHVHYLRQARSLGDRLIVAINDDESVRRLKGAGRPVMSLAQRMAVVAALGSVDWVIAFSEDTPAALIEAILPDVLVKGGDYQPQAIAGYDAVTAAGGEVKVLDFIEGESTSAIIDRIQGPSL